MFCQSLERKKIKPKTWIILASLHIDITWKAQSSLCFYAMFLRETKRQNARRGKYVHLSLKEGIVYCSWQHFLLLKQCPDQHFGLKLGVSMPAHASSLIVSQHPALRWMRRNGQ